MITNLSASSATVNQLDLTFTTLTGFEINGNDFTKDIPNYILVPGNGNLLLEGAGISGSSWAVFGGDLATQRDFYATGVVYASAVDTEKLSVSTIIPNLSVQNIWLSSVNTGLLSAVEFNNNIDLRSNNIDNVGDLRVNDRIDTDIIFANTYLGLTALNSFSIKDKWTELSVVAQPLGNSTIIASNTSSPPLTATGNEMFVTVMVEAPSATSYGEVYGMVVDTLGNVSIAGGVKVGNLGLLPNSDVEHALHPGMIIDSQQTFNFYVIDSFSYYLSTRDIANPVEVTQRVYQRQNLTFNLLQETLNVGSVCAASITANNINFTGMTVIDSNVTTLTASNIFATLMVNGSAFCMPLYKYN